MPELPEVETVVRTLEGMIQGEAIREVEVLFPKMIDRSPEAFRQQLIGRHFLRFSRRGKYLLFYLEDVLLVSHLRMEGKYWLKNETEPLEKHTHVIFTFESGMQLRYHDTRKFGTMELLPVDTDLTHFHGLGPEPFSDAFSEAYIYETAHHRNTPVKSLLLDQSFAAGIGNIYADEICFACGIRPGRNAKRLSRAQCGMISRETRRILSEAIRAGGTTIRSYTSSLGVSGLFQLECMVHTKKTCMICGGEIRHRRIGGRTSYYCPFCQK
ncbi:MAG: DNA-formamidopyrimidine glycosylase [Solobacterium sp.]|nr:DNA-formamidopyrimidine glycosylase [Solobacterium sp.]